VVTGGRGQQALDREDAREPTLRQDGKIVRALELRAGERRAHVADELFRVRGRDARGGMAASDPQPGLVHVALLRPESPRPCAGASWRRRSAHRGRRVLPSLIQVRLIRWD
jgi:hypothetical protein